MPLELVDAGPNWCDQFPTSRSTADLVEPFRSNVLAFLSELAQYGADVHISATLRPKERAYLMHWAWCVAREHVPPQDVPDFGVPIRWTYAGAVQMAATYGLKYKPSLTSHHITGQAIDMTITRWPQSEEALYTLGASLGVHKLRSDPPHWSVDGR